MEKHTETQNGHEEIYLVLRGRAIFTVGGNEHELAAGELVFVRDPALERSAIAVDDDTVVLALGGKPGAAHEISAWEAMFAAVPAANREDWDEAIRIHEEALAERPGHPALLYNLACMEARGGRLSTRSCICSALSRSSRSGRSTRAGTPTSRRSGANRAFRRSERLPVVETDDTGRLVLPVVRERDGGDRGDQSGDDRAGDHGLAEAAAAQPVTAPPVDRDQPRELEHMRQHVHRHRTEPDDEARLVEAEQETTSTERDDGDPGREQGDRRGDHDRRNEHTQESRGRAAAPVLLGAR